MESIFGQLGLTVLERGWLSSNNILFAGSVGATSALVDTGYSLHADQTRSLIGAHLGSEPLCRVLNTHLHSDHCGGNSTLRETWGCNVWVPAASFAAASSWDAAKLSFQLTDQGCSRFAVDRALEVGDRVKLGHYFWDVIAAPGHDPEAIMFFEPASRVLISGDALWESRLAIVFPELLGNTGFQDVERVLGVIESLRPSVVIPGHGKAFNQVDEALACSRRRLREFEIEPNRHVRYATRALIMFHMLEMRQQERGALIQWVLSTPIFAQLTSVPGVVPEKRTAIAAQAVDIMVRDGLLQRTGDYLSVP